MIALSNETLAEAVATRAAHPSSRAAAEALGIPATTLKNRLYRAAERGLMGYSPIMPGFSVKSVSSKDGDSWIRQTKEHGAEYQTPDGHSIKGESALIDAEGRIIQRWVKTRNEYSPEGVIDLLKSAFEDYPGYAIPTLTLDPIDADLLTVIPCNDWHINLLTWGRETGANWDLKIAEQVIGRGIEDAIDRSPIAGRAIVLGGGDLVHADTNENRTAQSGNILEADGRHQKGIEVAQRLKVKTIDAALRRNGHVTVRVLKGNHDEYSSAAIAYFLQAWYRKEPRVTVDVDPSLFFWFRFGKVLLGATHGHTVKLKDMAAIMAHRRAEDWGATKFRYVLGFHIHHSSKYATEGGGVISESFQAPIPPDAWHVGAGFLSGRSMQTITYHRDYGEVSRVRVAMLDAANDNDIEEQRKCA